ncbi:hypothetical protein B0A76_04565 [Pseudomonas fluorescens]|nr:hypothetical protein B0A76_04565 [Pseudomonas fluorescens]
MKAKCYKAVIGRESGFCNRGDGWRIDAASTRLARTKKAGEKKPRQLAGLRYERGARKSVQPGLPDDREAR